MKKLTTENHENRLSTFIGGSTIVFFIISARANISKLLLDLIAPNTIYTLAVVAYILLFIITLPAILKHWRQSALFWVVSVASVIAVSYLLFPENNEFFNETARTFITMSLPSVVVLQLIVDFNCLKRALYKSSEIICTISTIMLIALQGIENIEITGTAYQIGLGYAVLLPILILILKTNEKKNIYDVIILISSVVLVIARASRGPLMAIAAYIIYISIKKNVRKKQLARIAILLSLLVLAIVNFLKIQSIVGNSTEKIGVSSRTVTLITQDIAHDSGRKILYNTIQDEIAAAPLKVRGINSDYKVLGIYSHNILLELLFEFGVILGGIIAALLLLLSIKTLIGISDDDARNNLCTIFLLSSIPCLLVSSSLWIKYEFWFWLAIATNSLREKNTKEERALNA